MIFTSRFPPGQKSLLRLFSVLSFVAPASPWDAVFHGMLKATKVSYKTQLLRQAICLLREVLHQPALAHTGFTQSSFCTNQFAHNFFLRRLHLVHTLAFTHAFFYTNYPLQNLVLHQRIFTPTAFYTSQLLHKLVFYTTCFCTYQFLNRVALTQPGFHTKSLLHQPAFVPTSFYTNQLLHNPALIFTPTKLYTISLCISKHKTVYHWTGSSWPSSSRPLGQRIAGCFQINAQYIPGG